MKKEELKKYIGKEVYVYFKTNEKAVYGILKYADEFSEKHEYRKPGYFYIDNMSFKASHVKKVAEYLPLLNVGGRLMVRYR